MMNSVELVTYIKKLVDKFEKAGGIRVYPSFDDHIFKKVEINDTGKVISFDKQVYILKLSAKGCDIIVNLDRPIKDNEYTVVWADTSKIIQRKTKLIYAKTPPNLKGVLYIEGLTLNA